MISALVHHLDLDGAAVILVLPRAGRHPAVSSPTTPAGRMVAVTALRMPDWVACSP